MADPSMIFVEPIEGEGCVALTITYGSLKEGLTIEDIIEKNSKEVIEISGEEVGTLRFHISNGDPTFGPVYIGPYRAVFNNFIILAEENKMFHCDDCSILIMNWFLNMQEPWEKEFNDDRATHGTRRRQGSQRVH